MPTVKLSNPLSAAYAERLGLAVRAYAIGENVVVDTTLAQYLEFVGYGVVTDAPSPGAPLLFGSGAPAAGLGVNGSYYLDTAAQRVYGPKTSGGGWGSGTPLAGSTVLLGGMVVAPKGDKGDQGDPGPSGSTSVAIRAATDYDDATAPSTGQVIRWNGTKYAPRSLAASDVGAVSTTGAETVAGVKTFSSAPVVAAGTAAGNPIRYDDPSRTNARTPTAHASTHASGGSDAVTPSAIGAATSGHTHTAGSVGAAPASHQHDGSAITGGSLGLIDAINLEAQGGTPATPASGATLWTPGTLAVNALGSDGIQRRLKPIRAVTSWPPDAESAIGDEAIIEATGEHRIYKGTTLGWRQATTHYLTRAQREQYTSGAHLGMVVYETDTGQEWTWLPGGKWGLTGGKLPVCSMYRTASITAYTGMYYIPWDTVLVNETLPGGNMWASGQPTRIYMPADGIYDLTGTITWPNTANRSVAIGLRVNGAATYYRGGSVGTNGIFYTEINNTFEGVPLLKGDYVEMGSETDGNGAAWSPIVIAAARSVRFTVSYRRPPV